MTKYIKDINDEYIECKSWWNREKKIIFILTLITVFIIITAFDAGRFYGRKYIDGVIFDTIMNSIKRGEKLDIERKSNLKYYEFINSPSQNRFDLIVNDVYMGMPSEINQIMGVKEVWFHYMNEFRFTIEIYEDHVTKEHAINNYEKKLYTGYITRERVQKWIVEKIITPNIIDKSQIKGVEFKDRIDELNEKYMENLIPKNKLSIEDLLRLNQSGERILKIED